jgi:uncharacterized alpha-E superfamily protein
MMLSRVAERLYWMARYLERAEDTARLVNAYGHLALDLPRGAELGWDVLLRTLNVENSFAEAHKRTTERSVMRYLLADAGNVSSIRHSVQAARENVRTTRDVIPSQAWELMNEFNLYVQEMASASTARANRFEFLEAIVARNQQINGLIQTTATRNHTFWFVQLGQLLERSDMTSRIVDVATAAIGERSKDLLASVPLFWASLLHSLSATSAYRRQIGPIIKGDEVVGFIFKMAPFPRSLVHCINAIEETVGYLKAPGGMLIDLRRLARTITALDTKHISPPHLHAFVDQFQTRLGELHEAITETWFMPR